MTSDYVIDFERINQLTTTAFDKENGSPIGPILGHGISKSIIKDYLQVYQGRDSKHLNQVKLQEVIDTLVYNKILISRADIRDGKIDEVLK